MSFAARVATICLFVLSGMTSLTLQTVWIRVLSLGVGSTSAAIGMVLSIFFLGLAIGSYVAGRLAYRLQRPVLAYGAIEGAVGCYSVVLLYPLLNFHHLIAWMPLAGDFGWVGTIGKFFLVGILLLPPSIGMGASLPLLVRALVKNNDSIGRFLSLLYGINTIGAALGAFLGAFVFLPKLGIVWTNGLACVVNVGIFLLALLIQRLYSRDVTLPLVERSRKGSRSTYLSFRQRIILAVCGITGFSSIAAEVVWNKYLGIYFGTNIYGLGLILSIFLLGIAMGSFLLSLFIERVRDRILLFVWLLMAACLGLVVTSLLLNVAPLFANVTSYYLGDLANLLTIKSVIATVILLPTTIVFGALFPLAVRMITETSDRAPETVGLAYAINTIGSIIGSYGGGLLLIPTIGSSNTIKLAILVLVLISIIVLTNIFSRRAVRWVYIFALCILGVFVIQQPQIDFRNIIKSAYFQASDRNMTFSEVMKYFSRDYEEFQLIVEGKTGIISLSHDQQDGENFRDYFRLKTNGLNESIYNRRLPDELPKYEALLGLLPYVFSPDPESAFVVGYGGGFTVDLLTQLDIDDVYVAELEQGIIEAAQFVYNGDNPILKRDNLTLEVEDARFVLATESAGRKFDIIVSQPSHSWLSGVANLFTQEFFEIVEKNLSDVGVFSQWLNLYNMNETVLQSILHTFFQVFPHGLVFTDLEDQELIMIGSRQPLKIDLQRLSAMTQDELWRQKLRQVPFESPYDLLSNFSLSREEILSFTAESTINTDINAFAEVRQSALFYRSRTSFTEPQTVLSRQYRGNFVSFIDESVLDSPEFLYNQLTSMQRLGKFDKYQVVLDQFENRFSERLDQQINIGYLSLIAQRYHSASNLLGEHLSQDPTSEALDFYLATLSEMDQHEHVLAVFSEYANLQTTLSHCYQGMALLETKGPVEETRELMMTIAETEAATYEVGCGDFYAKLLGQYYAQIGFYANAIPYLEDTYLKFPNDVETIKWLIVSYLNEEQWNRAQDFAAYLPNAIAAKQEQLRSLAEFYRERGHEADAVILEQIASEWR